jgi:hypothetical protein
MPSWPTREQESRIRLHIYYNLFLDATDLYQASTGCSEDEAASFISTYAASLRESWSFPLKAFFCRVWLAICLAVPNGLMCAIAGVVWASAFGKNLLQFGVWAFCVSGFFAAILSTAFRRREGAAAMGLLFGGFSGLAVVLGIIAGIVRRLFF